jgi:hypothetical protein
MTIPMTPIPKKKPLDLPNYQDTLKQIPPPNPSPPRATNLNQAYKATTDPAFQAEKARQQQSNDMPIKIYNNGYQGLQYPDGSMFKGSEADANILLAVERKKKSIVADNQAIVDQTKQQYANDQLRQSTLASLTPQAPPNVSQDQLNQLDPNTIPAAPNNEVGSSITQNIQNKANLNPLNPKRQPTLQGALGFAPIAGIFNAQQVAEEGTKIPFIGSGVKAIVDQLSKNQAMRDYFQDYSNENNYASIDTEISKAKSSIKYAILTANRGGDSQSAIDTYRAGIARLRLANNQLKQIEAGDQRKYVETVRNKRIELETYFNDLPLLQAQMAIALQKPDPKYISQDNMGELTQ